MATESLIETSKSQGPSGFLELDQSMLVVDYGKVYHADGSAIGFLHEDGLIEGSAAPFDWQGMKTIEELPGAKFRGIDSRGVSIELPGPEDKRGPTGGLQYNGIALNVLYGRISTQEHFVVGYFSDDGIIHLRDHKTPTTLHQLDENSQLNTVFQGINSAGTPFIHEWTRPLHRKDRSYIDNEIIRYFEQFDKLTSQQKGYVLETMRIWASSGLLQLVRKSEGTAALGNVKHGASGVTGVRTGMVTLDREEFETEISLYKQYGPVAKVSTRLRPYLEVRINLVVSHEYGHQLEFTLSQAMQDKITDLYQGRLKTCNRLHPLPATYEGYSELLLMHQIEERIFISGYARTSMHEYWAECVAAFSVKESREMLRQMDPPVYQILHDALYLPEKTLSPKHETEARRLQSSLRVGGELTDDLLAK